MSDIEKIKQLRQSTGAGFKDCSAAIEESNGDIEKAAEILELSLLIAGSENQTINELELLLIEAGKLLSATGINDGVVSSTTLETVDNLFNPASIYVFANISGDAENIYKNLEGEFSFDKDQGIFCVSQKLKPLDFYIATTLINNEWPALTNLMQSVCEFDVDLFLVPHFS